MVSSIVHSPHHGTIVPSLHPTRVLRETMDNSTSENTSYFSHRIKHCTPRKRRSSKRRSIFSKFLKIFERPIYAKRLIPRKRQKQNFERRKRLQRQHRMNISRNLRKIWRPKAYQVDNGLRKYHKRTDRSNELSVSRKLYPATLSTFRKYHNFQNSILRKVQSPLSFPLSSYGQSRRGYGFRGGHQGVNAIYVGSNRNGILWPLLGLLGLFQLLTSGAIGNQNKYT